MLKFLVGFALSVGLSTTVFAHTATELTFMEGRWQGQYNNLNVVSHYIAGNWQVFVGRTYMLNKDGKAEFVELMRVEDHQGQLVLTPFPMGKRGVPFQLTAISANSATFENPSNPFPSKIQYTVVSGTLFTSVTGIQNGKPTETSYKQQRIPK